MSGPVQAMALEPSHDRQEFKSTATQADPSTTEDVQRFVAYSRRCGVRETRRLYGSGLYL